jgi:hypothetical protein
VAENSRKGGRPTACTPIVTDRIIEAVRAGNFLKHAARAAGEFPRAP